MSTVLQALKALSVGVGHCETEDFATAVHVLQSLEQTVRILAANNQLEELKFSIFEYVFLLRLSFLLKENSSTWSLFL